MNTIEMHIIINGSGVAYLVSTGGGSKNEIIWKICPVKTQSATKKGGQSKEKVP